MFKIKSDYQNFIKRISKKMTFTIVFIIIGFISFAFAALLYRNIINTETQNLKLAVQIFGIICILLTAVITWFEDLENKKDYTNLSSDNKQNFISVYKNFNEIKIKNSLLEKQINSLNETITIKNQSILDLTQQTTELSLRLSEKAKNIYDINKAIKFSIPHTINVSYTLELQIYENDIVKVDSIVSESFKKRGNEYLSIEDFEGIFDINDLFHEKIRIDFCKSTPIPNNSSLKYTPILTYSKDGGRINSENVRLLRYDKINKTFLIYFNDLQLNKRVLRPQIENTNLNSTILSLEGTQLKFGHGLLKFIIKSVQHFKIESKELNLIFKGAYGGIGINMFLGEVKIN